MKKKFAFILMGAHYTPEVHKAVFETESQLTYICTIKNFSEMEEKIKELGENSYLLLKKEFDIQDMIRKYKILYKQLGER